MNFSVNLRWGVGWINEVVESVQDAAVSGTGNHKGCPYDGLVWVEFHSISGLRCKGF